MTADEAAKLLAGTPRSKPVTAQVVPSPRKPAAGTQTAGAPVPPPADRHPEKDLKEDTSNLPAPQAGQADETAPPEETTGETPHLEDARALISVLPLLSPSLRHIPPGMRDELARLAARWLDAGHTSADLHQHILRGLPGAGTSVHRPGGLVRYLLRDVPPRTLPTPPAPAPDGPRLSPRLLGTRECAGHHTQPMLFRPRTDETLCPECALSVPGGELVLAPS
ncbi:hypothetical protein [Streptomyces sp. NPDC058326]|uniref:hypothetical protein n=1 Tax=Streptomyces sp. NPDC058326 TaxID=3346447 RepID=UPI0036E6D7CC